MQRSIVPASSRQIGYQEPLTDLGPCLQGMNLTLYFALFLVPCDLQIIMGLKVQPELGCGSEAACQAKGNIGGYRALFANNLIHSRGRHTQKHSELMRIQFQRDDELFPQNLAWVNWFQLLGHESPSVSVIIHDFNFVGVACPPFKTDPPLVIDSNAVLSFPVAVQFLQPVSGWSLQVVQRLGSMQHG